MTSTNTTITSHVTFSGPFHPLDDIAVSSYCPRGAHRGWRLCLLPEEDKLLLLQMHHDSRCAVPISIYIFAVMQIQRIFRGVLVRRRTMLVLSDPETRAVLHQSYNRLSDLDWDAIRFRFWRMAEAAVAQRYEQWYPRIAQDTMKDANVAASRFQKLRHVVCAKWRAALLNKEFNRWAQYDRWQIYFVAAITIQRAYREHRRYLIELSNTTSAAGKKKLMMARQRRRVMLLAANRRSPLNDELESPNNFSKLNNNNKKKNQNNNNDDDHFARIATTTKFQTRGEYRFDHFHPYSEMSKENFAAAVIQELFRRFVYRRVFLLFVRLIKSREGAPTLHVLRAVSPSESYLADRASGLHARFRLSAPLNPRDKFPPALVYKIFTHSNVADIGSFAPRNYVADRQLEWECQIGTSVRNSTSSATATHHQQQLATITDVRARNTQTKDGWYDRQDNNEWRPVADVALLSRRECGPEVIEATTHAAVRHFFSRYLAIPQKQRAVQDAVIDEYIRRTTKRAEETLRAATREKRADQRAKEVKQKQRKWMISLYAGSDTAIAQAASSVRKIVSDVQSMLKLKANSLGGETAGKINRVTTSAATSSSLQTTRTRTAPKISLRDEDISRLTKFEAKRTVDESFDCLTEEQQDEETKRLLQWTEHLDAKKYTEDWLKLGTTK